MRYMFGDYSLDTQRYELRRAGDFIPLGPQVFNVLAYLMVHRDRVVSRDELFELCTKKPVKNITHRSMRAFPSF